MSLNQKYAVTRKCKYNNNKLMNVSEVEKTKQDYLSINEQFEFKYSEHLFWTVIKSDNPSYIFHSISPRDLGYRCFAKLQI